MNLIAPVPIRPIPSQVANASAPTVTPPPAVAPSQQIVDVAEYTHPQSGQKFRVNVMADGTEKPVNQFEYDQAKAQHDKYLAEQDKSKLRAETNAQSAAIANILPDDESNKVITGYKQMGAQGLATPDELKKVLSSEYTNKPATRQAWEVKSKEWDAISAMPDGPEKDRARENYLYKYAPSTGYSSSQEAIDHSVKKEEALQSTKVETSAKTEGAKVWASKQAEAAANKALGLNRIDPSTQKPYSSSQFQAGGFALRMQHAENVMSQLAARNFDPTTVKNAILDRKYLNLIKDPDLRAYAQAKRDFVNSVLRRESGAAIAESEFASADLQYFPQVGDDAATIDQKKQSRLSSYSMMAAEAGGAKSLIEDEYAQNPGSTKPAPKAITPHANIPTFNSPRDPGFDKLVSGEKFIDSNGITRVKK